MVIDFRFQGNVVEQKSCERFCGLLPQHSKALYLISALFPFAVSHGDDPPCSDPQRGGTWRLNCEIIAARQRVTSRRSFDRRRKGQAAQVIRGL